MASPIPEIEITDDTDAPGRGCEDRNEWVRLQAVNVLDRTNDRSPENIIIPMPSNMPSRRRSP